MPLYYKKTVENTGRIAIWKVEESNEELLGKLSGFPGFPEPPSHLNHHYRVTEWCVTRLLLAALFEKEYCFEISYDDNGKPHLLNEGYHISISHTKGYVAVFVDKEKNVGIDIELLNPRIEKIAPKFLSEEEKKYIGDNHRLQQLYVIWGAKEVMFKLYSKGGIDFRKHLDVEAFEIGDSGTLVGHFRKDFNQTYSLSYEKLKDLNMVYGWEFEV